jgi:hypothetical protein
VRARAARRLRVATPCKGLPTKCLAGRADGRVNERGPAALRPRRGPARRGGSRDRRVDASLLRRRGFSPRAASPTSPGLSRWKWTGLPTFTSSRVGVLERGADCTRKAPAPASSMLGFPRHSLGTNVTSNTRPTLKRAGVVTPRPDVCGRLSKSEGFLAQILPGFWDTVFGVQARST